MAFSIVHGDIVTMDTDAIVMRLILSYSPEAASVGLFFAPPEKGQGSFRPNAWRKPLVRRGSRF